ncbi:MAG: putative hemolysin [Limisphaerales bacterium]|jgi:putative hemolysin
MTTHGAMTILGLLTFLGLSFILSGMESGVFALNRLRIRQRMREGKESARVLHGYLEDSERFLWTILVGNTIANTATLSVVTIAMFGWLKESPVWFVVAMLGVVFVFFSLFELLPKTLFRTYPTRLSMAIARPFRVVHVTLRPLVAIVRFFADALLAITGDKEYTGHLFRSRAELRQVMQENAGGLSQEERGMISRVMDLQVKTVRQASTPISKAVCVTLQTRMGEALAVAREHRLTRFPVWNQEAAPRRVVGMVSLKRLLYEGDVDEDRTVAHYVSSAIYLDENLPLDRAMRRMQRHGHRLAIVLDRNRKEIGLISLQDILRAVFGEVNL